MPIVGTKEDVNCSSTKRSVRQLLPGHTARARARTRQPRQVRLRRARAPVLELPTMRILSGVVPEGWPLEVMRRGRARVHVRRCVFFYPKSF